MTPHQPAVYSKPRDLSPALRRVFVERGWIDARTVTRLERPDPARVAALHRIQELVTASETVKVTA